MRFWRSTFNRNGFSLFLCYTITRRHRERMEGHIMAERNLDNSTVTMTKEEKKALKQAALDNDVSVSALIRLWLEKYQAENMKSD